MMSVNEAVLMSGFEYGTYEYNILKCNRRIGA